MLFSRTNFWIFDWINCCLIASPCWAYNSLTCSTVTLYCFATASKYSFKSSSVISIFSWAPIVKSVKYSFNDLSPCFLNSASICSSVAPETSLYCSSVKPFCWICCSKLALNDFASLAIILSDNSNVVLSMILFKISPKTFPFSALFFWTLIASFWCFSKSATVATPSIPKPVTNSSFNSGNCFVLISWIVQTNFASLPAKSLTYCSGNVTITSFFDSSVQPTNWSSNPGMNWPLPKTNSKFSAAPPSNSLPSTYPLKSKTTVSPNSAAPSTS